MKRNKNLQLSNIINKIQTKDLIYLLLSYIIFQIITHLVIQEKITQLDNQILNYFQQNFPDSFIHIAKFSYLLGEAEVAVFVVLFSLIFLTWKKFWQQAQILAVSSLSILILIDQILKPFFSIRRPTERLIRGITGYSYPSGHIAGNLFLYLFLAYIISQHFPQYKIHCYTIAIVSIILMTISILYLKIHWLSDILASYCLGYIIFTLAVLCLQNSTNSQKNIKK